MIGKIIAGSSFGATVSYVMKERSRILGFEGIEPLGIQDMVRDFKDQTLLNPRIKNAVGHISLSFSPKDADRLTDPVMAQIAREYMERMGIRNTQFLIVRHTDQAHPHCHIVYNRVGNDGQTISDKNIKIRNGRFAKNLQPNTGFITQEARSRCGANGCGNRTKPSTPFTTRFGAACPAVSLGAIWKSGCKSKVLRPSSNTAGTPISGKGYCLV